MQEGVVKFRSKHRPSDLPQWTMPTVRTLSAWRSILYELKLIGQDGVRYGGAAWGNVSARLPPWHEEGRRPFLITGTQTGGVANFEPRHFTQVQRCSVGDGFVESEGPSAPSSEAMTHAAMYGVDEHLRFVFHVHSVEIWRHARRLELPATAPEIEYGTAQMAWAVEKLMQQRRTREAGAIAMLGHEDGVITFGETPEQAGEAMMRWLARARSLPATHG